MIEQAQAKLTDNYKETNMNARLTELIEEHGESKIVELVEKHLEMIDNRKEYNKKRAQDPGVKEKRQEYQKTRNEKIKLALAIYKERGGK